MNILVDGQTLETEEINRGIGVYFKNVLYNMIKHTAGTVWYITVSWADSVNQLEPWIVNRLVPVVDEIFAPSFDYGRAAQFTDRLNEIIERYHIDCVWTPNPLMVNVLFPNKEVNCEFFATIHDLIPYVMPVKEWSEDVTSEYNRRLEYLKNVHMICVSDATKRDVVARMGNDVSASVTLEAANNKLFYRKKEILNTSDEISVVFTGGFDYRKNIYGAIEAFAAAKKNITDKNLIFYIVCKYAPHEKEQFEKKLKELEIHENVRLTGFITDNQLAELYNRADVFFFPSFYEGFGLPLLEAMLGGAYILSADNSSLPEVCGNNALYCKADDVDDMAEKLTAAVRNSLDESLEDKQKRQEYALEFTWKKTATKTFTAICENVYRRKTVRKKIAVVTPWLKQETGIANFSYRLMPFLNKWFDVDIFIDNTLDKDVDFLPYEYGSRYFIDELDNRHANYDEIIYHIGNNTLYHTGIYNYLKKYPGIVELHDHVIHAFFYHSYYLKGDRETYRQALIDGYGAAGAEHFEEVDSGRHYPDGEKFSMSESVSNISKKIIVHNIWSYMQLPEDNLKYVVPHPCFEREELSVNNKRMAEELIHKKINKNDDEILIACFGWVNDNKRPDVLIRAVAELISLNYKVRLVFFGKNNSQKVTDIIKEEKIAEHVEITGFISAEEYTVALKECAIVVNLRYPSMGESSGTLCEAFKEGKAVIVTAVNQYLEFPDEVCWKLPVCSNESVILAEMIKYLIDHDDVRETLGRNAREYADEVLSCENIAQMYSRIIN